MITEQNLTKHELIGLHATVASSSNNQIVGLHGKIVDETKSMLYLDTASGIKMIPKSHSTWKFDLVSNQVTIDGQMIAKRSYERMGVKP